MSSLLIAPHSDDEILFASYLIRKYAPTVVIVADDPDPTQALLRRGESERACKLLDARVEPHWLHFTEGAINRDELKSRLADFSATQVFAPAVEASGHDEHNLVGEVALELYGKKVRPYLTYTRAAGRSRNPYGEIYPWSVECISRKLRALAEFRTQIQHPARRPWFYDQLDMREWFA